MKLVDILFDLLIAAVVLIHLVAAPYTKVEESFNIQATHDISVYGAPDLLGGLFSGSQSAARKLTSYDHSTFPGAVPRTFIGPLFLSTFSGPFYALFGFAHAQLIARAILGLFNATALVYFKHQLGTACGPAASRWYATLQASQFHIMFYASRTLPNMYAFGLTTFAFGLLLPPNKPHRANGRIRLSVMLFVFAAVVFRSEVALLLGANALWLLIIPQASLHQLIPPFIVSFVLSILITVLVDSYFWQKWLWPELWGFYYNVVQGSASEWGTSPWVYYFKSALPKLLLNPLAIPLIIYAYFSPAYYRIVMRLVIPELLFVAIYSFQPHKEARFIFYVVPPLTAAAAIGATTLTTGAFSSSDNRAFTKKVKFLVLAASIFASSLASAGMLLASSLNYPGGEALGALHQMVRADQTNVLSSVVTFHADVLSCMTGVTLFGVAGGDNVPTRHNFILEEDLVVAGTGNTKEAPAAWLMLDKTEDAGSLADPNFWQRFDYLLVENEAAVKGGRWDTVAVVEGLSGFEMLRPGSEPEESEPKGVQRVGRAAQLAALRDRVRGLTGGWWAGPRLAPKIRVMKRVKDTADRATKGNLATF